MTRSLLEPPTIQEASCLIQWPKGSPGFDQEKHVLEIMIALCGMIGFGRFGQLAVTLEDLWRYPERGPFYQKFHDELNELRRMGQLYINQAGNKDFVKGYEAQEKKVAALQEQLTIDPRR